MYHQIYKAVAAATVAGSLVLQVGAAWALDANFGNTVASGPAINWSPLPPAAGCDGGRLGTTKYFDGTNNVITASVSGGSALGDFVQTFFTVGGDFVRANGIAQSDPFDFGFGNPFNFLSTLCPNLTDIATVSANTITDAAAYAAAGFVGNIFEATDTNDGLRYRYTVGFEGVTGTVPMFRRELVSTGAPAGATVAEATNEGIADATLARARAALANQPNLTPLLADRPEWYFDANAGNDTAFLRFIRGPVWFNLDYSRLTVGLLDNDIIHGVLGSHRQFSPNLIFGSMLQFDIIDSAGGDFAQTSNGFLAGPYFVASNAARTLFMDGSLLYGKSWNEISPTDAYTDDYTSERWLATVKVSGNIERDAFTLRPNVNVKYVSDENESYVDNLGNGIAASGVTIAQAAIGLDAIIPVAVASGSLDLLLGVSGIHSEEAFTGASAVIRDDMSQSRSRIDLGFEWQGEAGSVFTASMFYDGLGVDDFEAQGLSLAYHITF